MSPELAIWADLNVVSGAMMLARSHPRLCGSLLGFQRLLMSASKASDSEHAVALPLQHRLIRFGVVGGSGVVVNLAVFTAGQAIARLYFIDDIAFQIAVALGIIVSIGTNFLLNDRWTWGDLRKGAATRSWLHRLWRFYAVSFASGALNFAVARQLRVILDSNPYVAVLGGIACAMSMNFVVNHWWTFRTKVTADGSQDDERVRAPSTEP